MNNQIKCWSWFYSVNSPSSLTRYFELNSFLKGHKNHLLVMVAELLFKDSLLDLQEGIADEHEQQDKTTDGRVTCHQFYQTYHWHLIVFAPTFSLWWVTRQWKILQLFMRWLFISIDLYGILTLFFSQSIVIVATTRYNIYVNCPLLLDTDRFNHAFRCRERMPYDFSWNQWLWWLKRMRH